MSARIISACVVFARSFVMCLLVFGTVCSGLAQTAPPAPKRVVQGIVTTENGTPLARATLYLFGLPPGQTDMMTLGADTTVVTDAHGHFTWNVPAALPPLDFYINVRRTLDCYVLPADRGAERFRVAFPPYADKIDIEQGTREALARATRLCQAHWVKGSNPPLLSVVVPALSRVVLTMRGPDGQPLRSQEVTAAPVQSFFYQGIMVTTGRTDAAGHLSLRCFPGTYQFGVFAAGVGSGLTEVFSVVANQTAAPVILPLAPFAQISGTVAAALRKPGATVYLRDFPSINNWYQTPAAVMADGQWTLSDVLPGKHLVTINGAAEERSEVDVTALPGQTISDIVIAPQKLVVISAATASAMRYGLPEHITRPDAVVEGRVTDASGKPVTGADVYAVCVFSTMMSSDQRAIVTKTDTEGRYSISRWPESNAYWEFPLTMVAHLPGFSPAVADVRLAQTSDSLRAVTHDFVLPAGSAGLSVRVLQNGLPAPNIPVSLTLPGRAVIASGFFHGADRSEAAQALRSLLTPSVHTDADGTATFKDLTPDLWNINANREMVNLIEDNAVPGNISTGIAVQAGQNGVYTLRLLPHPGPIDFRVLLPDGKMLPAVPSTEKHGNYGGAGLAPLGTGIFRREYFSSGMIQFTTRIGEDFRETSTSTGPYYTGSVLVAASPAIDARVPVVVQMRRVGAASLRVRLQDADGKPARGAVMVGERVGEAQYGASVGPNGVVIFPKIPEENYVVAAYFPGRPKRAVLITPGKPLPSDAALRAGTGQPLPVAGTIKPGEQASVTLGGVLTGYVRLHLKGLPAEVKNIYVEAGLPGDENLSSRKFDPVTQEYVVGPLPPGRRTFKVYQLLPAPVDNAYNSGEVTLTVKSGQVVTADVTLHPTAAQEDPYSAPLTGTVLLPDGKPAWGARAALFLPKDFYPRLMARADTLGHLTLSDDWQVERSPLSPPSVLTEPTLAVWLPGANGAAIVPYHPGQAERLVLPPACTLTGRVTVGGQSVMGMPSQFRVRAAYQGRGELNEALSVEANAEADGTFTLAGLTPGTYLVQAARDNIWLSPAQTLTASAEAPAPTTLDIDPPGAPMLLHLTDIHGKLHAGQTVYLNLPTGPLTDLLWPQTLTADSRGDLRVEGLTAGPHSVTVGRTTLAFRVPPFAASRLPVRRDLAIEAH